MVRLDEIRPGVWDATVEVMEEALRDLEFDGDDIVYNWRKDANLKRRERELFEKYGFLKDVILNPTFQEWKQWFDEVWDRSAPSLDVTLGDPIMPLATCIIVLFLLNNRVPRDVLVLAGGILFNVNPIYVVLGTALFHFSLRWFRAKPKQFVKIAQKKAREGDDLAVPYSDSQICSLGKDRESQKDGIASNLFDHVLIGGDISTLFAAALLSKVGHRCCVLQPEGECPSSVESKEAPCSIPLTNLMVNKPERYQALLDLVQHGLTGKERVHLVPIGRPEEGYTHTLIRPLPGQGTADQTIGSRSPSYKKTQGAPVSARDIWCLRPSSISGFVNELASRFLVVASGEPLMDLFKAISAQTNDGTTSFLLNRSMSASVQQPPAGESSGLTKSQADTNFNSVSCASLTEVLARAGIEENSPEFKIVYGAALAATDELSLSPSESSGNTLAQALASLESGLYYPRGGSCALEKAMTAVIHRAGGLVVSQAPVKEIVMEPRPNHQTTDSQSGDETLSSSNSSSSSSSKSGLSNFVADRVALDDGQDVYANKAIISGVGIIGTYSNLLFGQESDKIDPKELSLLKKRVFGSILADLTEGKPVLKAVFGLRAVSENEEDADTDAETESGDDSRDNIPRHNYKAMPGAVDYIEYHSDGAGAGAGMDNNQSPALRVWSPSARDPDWLTRCPDMQVIVMEYECSEPYITRRKLTGSGIPLDSTDSDTRGPTVYIRRSEEIYMTEQHRTEFLRHAQRKLRQLYPALASDSRIIHSQCVLPSRLEGSRCANTISKFAKPLSAVSDLEGLYFCGRDVATSGGLSADLQGGFVAANAVLGYNIRDKASDRNVIGDLRNIT